MLNRFIALFLTLLLISACKDEAPLEFAIESMDETTLDLCSNDTCPEITITYPEYLGEDKTSENINTAIKTFVISSLNIGEEKTPSAKSIEEAAKEFALVYQEDRALYADMAAEYMAEISVSESFRSDELVSLEMKQFKFTGGAHGFGSVFYNNIDLTNGQTISSKALLKDEAEFLKLAEKHFRETYSISENESVNAPGFWFENDVFYLPETLGFIDDNLVFVYNQYDIASYAEGPIEIAIPLSEAQPFLNYDVEQ